MPTPTEIMSSSASLQNDSAKTVYTDDAQLPYFNMALRHLQEIFELNDIPVTHEVSAVLPIDAGTTVIAITGTIPTYPNNLIEIKQLWESSRGQNKWTPMTKRDFLPHGMEGVPLASFGVWAWINNEIHLLESSQNNDLKLDYIKSLFSSITKETIEDELGTKFTKVQTYLEFRLAALCAYFIGEDVDRALVLQKEADDAMDRSLGISVKGQQAIFTRRRPFRAAYKSRRFA